MRLTRCQRESIEVIEGEGLRTLSVRCGRGGHLKVKAVRKDGQRMTFVVPSSTTSRRGRLNLRALARRFARR